MDEFNQTPENRQPNILNLKKSTNHTESGGQPKEKTWQFFIGPHWCCHRCIARLVYYADGNSTETTIR